jgi:hypothetical protein
LTVCAAAQGLTEQPQHGGHIAPSTMANGDRKQQLAESQKRRMVGALSTANGICVGLEEADVAAIVSVCEAKEIRDWAEKSRELANKLRNFAKRLEKGE